MSKHTAKYGHNIIQFNILNDNNLTVLRTASPIADSDERDIVRNILSHPINSQSLVRFVTKGDEAEGSRVAIIVSDKTRLCNTHVFLPILLEQILSQEIDKKNITIIFANGTHPAQTEEEKRRIIGDDIYSTYKIIEHDSRDEQETIYLGTTKFGTDIKINKDVAVADKIIATGTIVHHYFAGFGGGAKLLMPGVAAHSSALQNHKRTLTENGQFNPNCFDSATKGNPVYEDIIDAVRFYPPVFYFAALLNQEGKIFDGVCGDLIEAHNTGAEKVDALYKTPIQEKADLVIVSAGGYPKDINFIQSHKSLQHAYYATKKEGVIICFAACEQGIGNAAFLDWFRYSTDDEMRTALLNNYSMNGHTALSLKNKTKDVKIIFISELDSKDVELMGMIPASDFQEAHSIAKKYLPHNHSAFFIENGSQCVPAVMT